jgi:hypothetical protein
MQLGDAIKLLGQPIALSACSYLEKIVSDPIWAVHSRFMGHVSIGAYASLNLDKDSSVRYIIDPSMIVYDIWYASSVTEEDVDTQKWHGFTQIEPGTACGAIFMP